MNVLIDYHHSDLMESLYRLFEDRLGMRVYVPRGLEWWQSGIWQFGRQYLDGGEGVAKQFLLASERDELQPQRDIHWVTLDEAKQMDWRLCLASVPDNYSGFHDFAWERGAQFGIEVGNVNQWIDMRLDPVVLDSTGVYGHGTPFTPEWDWRGAFQFRSPMVEGVVASFVNLFPHLPCYSLFQQVKALDSTHSYLVYGHAAQFVKPTRRIGFLMAHSDFGWHDKITGDGFGYVIHYWASVGRPLIGHASHYRGQLAADLWTDGETCIDLDRHEPAEVAELIQTSDVAAMGAEIHRRLMARLDFGADAARVAAALGLDGVALSVPPLVLSGAAP